MAAPINLPVNAQLQNQTQLERQLQQATQNLRINFATGNSARSLGALSQPLGRLTGQADEFSKSLDAANARVLAFGASVGIVNTLTNAFKSLVNSTIEVEKAITAISVVGDQFAGKNKQLSQGLFSIAKATGQSFQEVSKAALEFSRQGLSLEDTLQRTQNALILTRLTGLDAAKAVDGLTASVNAFSKAGLNTTQIINKLAAVDQAFAVSSADLIEGFNRSAAVAQNAGVTFDELAGIITALQQETSRGGAVIGNALKTIFTRLQDTSTLNQLKNLGVAVQDLQGNLLPARQILQNLATDIEGLGQITKAGVFKDVAGTFQINQLISLVGDLGKENSIAAAATRKAAGATNEAFIANEKLNQSLDAILNKIANAGQQFGSLLGEIGITDGFRELLGYIDSFLEGANKLLQGDDLGSRFAKGLVKGIGSVLTGPGIGIILAVIAKLGVDLAKFGVQSLKTFFGIGQAARDQQKIQESIVQTLIRNQSVLSQILNTQGGQNAQAQTFLNILRQEEQVLQNIRTIAGGIAAPLISQGYRAGAQGIQRRSAGGYLPAQEASDVRRGVGGASPNSKVVAIPNFAFGGGKRGTMIANTSEYIVPNYAGGGSAIFNQNMAKTMGLPPGAKKITAAGGFIPNFAPTNVSKQFAVITNDDNLAGPKLITAKPNKKEYEGDGYDLFLYGIPRKKLNEQNTGFRNEQLIDKYRKYAIEDAKNYALAVGGRSLQPYEIEKVSNEGALAGLIGAIFEDGIGGVISSPTLRQKQAERRVNEKIDFRNQKDINKFYGIDPSVEYIEAKYSQNVSGLSTSVGNKIFNTLQGSVAGEIIKRETSGQGGRPLKIRKDNFLNQLLIVRGRNFQAQGLSADQIEQLKRAGGFQTNASRGYIPNFAASALMDAISREKSAGLSASQIYVDQSPALKSSSNPMGLMVANRRDEPAGGFQGIARARKEGMNPKTYGAARGFVPNYVLPPGGATQSTLYPPNSTTNNSATNTQTNTRTQQTQTRTIQDSIGALVSLQIVSSALTGIFSEASENVQKFGTAVSSAIIGVQGIKELGRTEGGAGFGANFRTNSARSRREIGVGFRLARRGVENFSFGGISKGLGLVTKGLFRFAPLIGQAVLAFDILNSTLKIFGVDLVKIGTDFFRGVNDAGQKARDSITEFATALDEGTGRISGENLFDILQKRANLLIEENKFKAAGIAQPKTEEELAKARETVLRQTSAAAFKELRGGQTIEQNIAKLGERQEQRGRTRVTTTIQTLSGSVRKSAEEAYIEAFSGIERLSDESIKKLAPTLGIKGDNVKELRESILKQVSEDLDQQLKTAKATSSNGEDFVATFRQLANTSIFGRIISRLKATPQQAEAFAKRTEENINSYLISEKDFFDRKNKQFAEAVNLFSSATATKTFSSLDIATQTKKLNALDIGKSQQAFIQQLTDFAAQARQELSTQYQGLALQAGLDTQQSQQIESFIKGFDPSNIQAFNEGLNNLVERLGGVDAEIINKLRSIANNFSGQQEEIISKRGNELKLLQFTIEERNLETKAIQTYNKNIVTFGRSIFDAEQRIQEFNSKLKILDLQKDFDIAISDAFASSGEDSLLKRQEIERTNFEKQAVIQAKIAEEQARIELKRTLVTQENIVALNRNTTALKELLDIQSLVQERTLREELNQLDAKRYGASGEFTPADESLYNQISNVLRAITERRAVNPSATGPNASGGVNTSAFREFTSASVEDLIKGYKGSLQGAETPQQVEAAIESYVQTLGYSEELTIRVRDALITYSRSTESAGVAQSNLRTELEKAQELEKNKNTLLSTYAATIQAQIKAGQDALLVPQTMGEFAAQKRKNELAQEALNISQRGIENPDQLRRDNPEEYRRRVSLNDSAVREFLSSGRYGFEEGLIELEQKTLDFRKELGQEIPRLFSSNLAQGLNDAISGAKSLKDALRDAATSFFQAITQKNIENLANLFTVNLGNTGASLFKANGGLISGGSGTKDDIPAMLMGGEYVIKKSAVKKYGSGFFDALNKGSVKGFANGGGVQSGTGGFYVPGDYGTGGIRGKRQLLSFATQSFTSGQYDTMGGFGIGGASVSLEAESGRLSQFGRQNNPMFERVQESKQQAFDVYLQQLKQEEQYEEQLKEIEQREKERQKQLVTSIASAVISSLVSVAAKKANIGAENEIAANEVAGKTLTGTERAITGLKGAGKGIFTSQGRALSQDAILMRSVRDTSLQNINFAGSGRNISERPFGLSNSVLRSGNSSFRSSPNLPLPTGGPNIDLSLFGLPNYGSDGFYRPYPKRYNGGYITGGSGMRDDVPAMLTGGEFVLNNRATRKLGVQNLNRLNAGETGGGEDRSGAVTESLLSKLDELIQATRDSSGDNVVVNVSSNEAGGMTESNSGNEKELQRKIRQAVLDVIAQEKRLGGSLNKDK
jgi:TP901 family phage tail tape measure protein